MELPFTSEQFLEVFRNYNTTFYPLQVVFMLSAIFTFLLVLKPGKLSGALILTIMAAWWGWMGFVYHILFFSQINKAAFLFGALFILEGILLLNYAFRETTEFLFRKNPYRITSILLLCYALIIYPVIGYFNGHRYPYSPTFALPCPTTIFTFGIMLLSKNRLPLYLLLIPVIWSVIGFTAAILLNMYEDTALIVCGVLIMVLNFVKPRMLKAVDVKTSYVITPV